MPLFSGKCKSKARLDGKTAVVTGCNTGIGKETVRDFIKRGCRVIMACRDTSKAEDAANDVRKSMEGVKDVGEIVVVHLDLSSFASVRKCAAHLLRTEPAINLLVNNAAIALCPKGLTEDGFETQFGVNHLGHFLFTLLLLPRILKSTPARIVIVSSLGHTVGEINFDDINSDKNYNHTSVYAQSKLANVLFSNELARRLQGTGVTTYSLHPGIVDTNLSRHADSAYFKGSQWLIKNVLSHAIKSPEQGAQTTIYCAVDEKVANETGLYYSDCKKTKASSKARDPALALRLWEESIKMTGLHDYDPFNDVSTKTEEQTMEATNTDSTTSGIDVATSSIPAHTQPLLVPSVDQESKSASISDTLITTDITLDLTENKENRDVILNSGDKAIPAIEQSSLEMESSTFQKPVSKNIPITTLADKKIKRVHPDSRGPIEHIPSIRQSLYEDGFSEDRFYEDVFYEETEDDTIPTTSL